MTDRQRGRKKQAGCPGVVHLVSLGCAKNLVDSEIMLGAAAQAGYAITTSPEDADFIIINTCGFVQDAIEESYEVIEEMLEYRTNGACSRLVVAGCLAQRFMDGLKVRYPGIDVLVGTFNYNNIVQTLTGECMNLLSERPYLPDHTAPRLPSTPPWTAYLRIAEGCNNRSAYCMIPSIRGAYRSRTIDSLVAEARDLAALGVREIVLIAQDSTLYGHGLQAPAPELFDLLSALENVEQIKWIRVMYCHPSRIDTRLLEKIASSNKILNYLDMPMQHSHQDILKAMNRPDNFVSIMETIGLARKLMPDICIRTTLLVGFPGEKEKHIEHMLDFISEAKFDRLGVFKFSAESGAPAALLSGQISEPVKAERFERVMERQQNISLEMNRAWIGRELEVLIESATDAPGVVAGRSFRDAPDVDGVVFVEGKFRPGDFVTVKIRQATHYDLVGQPIRALKNRKK